MPKRSHLLLPIIAFAFSLTGCSGGVSGENGDDPFGAGEQSPSIAVSTQTLDGQCVNPQVSFTAGETLCVRASLPASLSNRSGQVIRFSSSLGALSSDSRLTDTNGVAEILISSTGSDIGASTLTATFGQNSGQANYEFLAPETTVVVTPSLSLSFLKDGVATNRLTVNEQATLQAKFTDELGNPVSGSIITFTSGKGTLNTSDALTNADGLAQVLLSANEGELGAATITVSTTVNEEQIFEQFNFEIQASDTVEERITRIGHFDANGNFIEGQLGLSISSNQISAGGTLGLSVALVDQNDQRITTQIPVNFTSTCVQAEQANIDTSVNTINGVANATYEDISCAGGSGNVDNIVASVIVNNSPVILNQELEIQAESLGSIGFVSATPTQIVLQGTGGQNTQTLSTLVYKVTGALGNPLAQQTVRFTLNTEAGGLTLAPESGITNSEGEVSVRVTSGNVPTSVRVTAEVTASNGRVLQTQSDQLAVNTGLPDQNSITLSATNLNPEADQRSGEEVTLVTRLADSFNNPVPDGTTVSFTTEGGTIEPSCSTTNGRCTVTWTSASPRVADNRITILATAIGHETLIDSNGNNVFDDADGGPVLGFTTSTGFKDLPEAWRDDNFNNIRESTEPFIDFNNNQQYDGPDGLFNGPQCQATSLCGLGSNSSIHVRDSIELVMASSVANWWIYLNDPADDSNIRLSSDDSDQSFDIPAGESSELILVFNDLAGQVMPSSTIVADLDAEGEIDSTLFTVPNNADEFDGDIRGHAVRLASISSEDSTTSSQRFEFVIQAPSGTRTIVNFTVNP